MPTIRINEKEEQLYREFDASDNSVLIPILVNECLDDIKSALYDSVKSFTKDFGSYNSSTGYIEKNSIRTLPDINDGDSISEDRTYYMIYQLLYSGLSVYVEPIHITANAESEGYINYNEALVLIKDLFENNQAKYCSRNLYNFKFISSGAYANYRIGSTDSEGKVEYPAISESMIEIASSRGDCIALLECDENFKSTEDFITKIISSSEEASLDAKYKYASLFFPWCTFNIITKDISLPASFAYLIAYANSVRTNANWFAAAGVNRGVIPGLIAPNLEVTEAEMHNMQADDESDIDIIHHVIVNPIMDTGAYGVRIWGNKTAYFSTNGIMQHLYTDFLNVRVLVSDIKKQVYHTAMRTSFEPNDDIVWLNFKSLASSLLDKMKSGRGISWYKWAKSKSDDKGKIIAHLTIKPIEAVESFDITVVLSNEEEAETNEERIV